PGAVVVAVVGAQFRRQETGVRSQSGSRSGIGFSVSCLLSPVSYPRGHIVVGRREVARPRVLQERHLVERHEPVPAGVGAVGPTVSRNRSVLSVSPAVTPQAANPLCPMPNPGVPTSMAPAASHSGVRAWARYHGGGAVGARCGSLARMGLPDRVRLPAITQLF